MKQNKGYTLVELIVVIAILVVLTGAGVLQMRSVFSYYAKQCAENLEAQLNRVQIVNMARKTTEMEIYQSASDHAYYVRVTENKGIAAAEKITEKQVGRSSLLITYSTDTADTNVHTLGGGDSIIIRFDRSTGALKVTDDSDPSKVIGAHRIWIRQKGNKSKVYTVTIHQETGKIEVDADEVKNSP